MNVTKSRDLGMVIAERSLSYVVPGEEPRTVVVRLGAPQEYPGKEGWYCPWQILGVGTEDVKEAAGVDAFQALQLVMEMIGVTLYSQVELGGVEMSWLNSSTRDLGFPDLPRRQRDT